MPRPGSHGYDAKRARTRKDMEHKGLSEQELDKNVKKKLQSEPGMRPRKVGGDRAEGPQSERPAKGERPRGERSGGDQG
ncbi:hypothetical protein EDD27_0962 [Nonomuraea polychroma]|uniref:Uncharacterized protein n=1 Tax=Nonomuraea polychroma TaxID=46176 RepID=A0A438LYP6_9ACTN|nr:hypothetical protein [Nonomuraea polychroma]RVX38640.1 hypothetical protein EDD27_0962 [Nonomuraea polychroma]